MPARTRTLAPSTSGRSSTSSGTTSSSLVTATQSGCVAKSTRHLPAASSTLFTVPTIPCPARPHPVVGLSMACFTRTRAPTVTTEAGALGASNDTDRTASISFSSPIQPFCASKSTFIRPCALSKLTTAPISPGFTDPQPLKGVGEGDKGGGE